MDIEQKIAEENAVLIGMKRIKVQIEKEQDKRTLESLHHLLNVFHNIMMRDFE